MGYQTYRPLTKPSKTRKTFTRSNFADHNYNYVNPSQTTQPHRRELQNHLFSQKWNLPNTSQNPVNVQVHPYPPQDSSENYPFFQQNRMNNKHPTIQTIYHPMMMIISNQIFLHHIPTNIVQKNPTNSNISKCKNLPTKPS